MKKLFLVLGGMALFWSGVFAGWENFRDLETMTVVGYQLPQFNSRSIDQIFVFAYHQNSDSWQQITHQIDEKDGGDTYFINPNHNLDNNDDLFFMARDAGDKAAAYQWIDDDNSKYLNRYEVEIADPLNPLIKKYVYIYYSTTLIPAAGLPVYMAYTPATSGGNDKIAAAGYLEDHHAKGFPENIKIPESAGGSNIDFFDRQKARVKGTYKVSIFSYDYKLDEDDLQLDGWISYISGPIRTVRDITYKTSIAGLKTITVGTFKYQYYPYHIVSFGTNKVLSSDYGIKLIRQSFDLNINAVGMLYIDEERENVVVDGVPEWVIKSVYPIPKINWYMYSGNPGSMLVINTFEALSNATPSFYYRDTDFGGASDDTDDTGDGRSYGDAGIRFDGNKIQGKFSIPYTAFFLPANRTQTDAISVVDNYKYPLTTIFNSQNYVTPVEIAVSLPDTAGALQMPITIPLIIGNLQSMEITTCRFTIRYDPQVLSIEQVSTNNTLTANWNPPVVNFYADSVTILLEGTTPLQSSGILANLNCLPIGETGQSTNLIFSKAEFNQGYPFAAPQNGMFTVLPPPSVSVSLPDTSAASNTIISVPVRVEDVTGLNVKSCHIEIQYDKNILFSPTVSTEATICSGWQVNVNNGVGSVTIDLNGSAALTGSGFLVRISFNAIGSAGESSILHFKSMRFNSGVPVANVTDGRISIHSAPLFEVVVSVPDYTVQSGSYVTVPINISSTTNLAIYSYTLILNYNPEIIDYVSASTNASLSANWNAPRVIDFSDRVIVTASGSTPLTGAGALLFLNFYVPGEIGSNTALHFVAMTFGSNLVFVTTSDGSITVLGAVPVELAFFSARPEANRVVLNWTTVSESDNYGFYVQRRTNSDPIWETIGFEKGVGTTSVPQSYSFIDEHVVGGAYYYRLKQQDFDGSFNLSPEIKAEIVTPGEFVLFQNYPNPFNAVTSIKYELAEQCIVTLVIFNILGQPIKNLVQQEFQPAGVYQVNWDGENENGEKVTSGIYYMQLQTENIKLNKKIVFIE